MFNKKKLLITGGTGSFGGAVLKRFLLDGVIEEIRVFSRDEKKQDDLRHQLNDSRVKFYLGDVRDIYSIDEAMTGVDFVFHAAALKQVPSCEFFPLEAVKTNILGTSNVLESAIRNEVKKVIVLSTDKAAYPINAMGISKAMMEKVAFAKARSLGQKSPTICCTRYGNVMASRGSVIPLWIEQIKAGKEISMTDQNMTRFMMSLDESVDLVMYAMLNGKNGDLFVQKAPAATLEVLARALTKLLHAELKIKLIGTRHGEKLFETLVTREEMARSVDLGGYFRIPLDNRDLNYESYFESGEQKIALVDDYHSHNTYRLTVDEMLEKLVKLGLV